MKLNYIQIAKITETVAPVMPPKEIEAEFGIPTHTTYYNCLKYGIPKYRASRAERKKEALEIFLEDEAEIKAARIAAARRIANGSNNY